jgi:hypothetical protein
VEQLAKFYCATHKVELEVVGNTRRYGGLSWAGSAQCALMTMREPREGVYGECVIKRVG